MEFTRYAVYLTPDSKDFATAGANWLGWDLATGTPVGTPDDTVTKRPRKYGFHGTMKPPFRLADDMSAAGLLDVFCALCSDAQPIVLQGLMLARIGGFLALVPTGDFTELADLAGRTVSELDQFRAPASDAELARRRTSRLTPEQDGNLLKWGYPYVFDTFRFHMTLTGPLKRDHVDGVMTKASDHFARVLPSPFVIRSLTLVGERPDSMFQEIKRGMLGQPLSSNLV